MIVVLRILIGLAVLVAVVLAAGMALPKNHRAASRIAIAKPPEQVWAVVRDLGALQGTWSELKSARRLPDESGKEVWEQNAGGFPMRLVVEASEPPQRLVTRVNAPADASFGGTWTYEIAPSALGTTVTVTEDGYVNNPLFRVMMRLMGSHRTADGYLKALGQKFGETVKPKHL